MDGVAHLRLVPQRLVARQQIVPADLGDDQRQVLLMNIGVVGINNVFYALRQTAENIEVLGVGKTSDFQRADQQGQVGVKFSGGDAIDVQGPAIDFKAPGD